MRSNAVMSAMDYFLCFETRIKEQTIGMMLDMHLKTK